MKFNNLSGFFSYKVVSMILLVLCILIALAFSNMSQFGGESPLKEGLLTLGDAVAISSMIKNSENVIWQSLVDAYKNDINPEVTSILAESSSPSTQFGKLRSKLTKESDRAILSAINLQISQGYKAIYQKLLKDFGTNIDANPSFTQGCDGAESCVINAKTMADTQMASMGSGGGA